VASILAQLCAQFYASARSLPKVVQNLYSSDQQQPRINELEKTLQSLIKTMSRMYMILDALDECCERDALLPFILSSLEETGGKLRVLVLSRREEDIEAALSPSSQSICLQSSPVSADIGLDIELHIAERLRQFTKWPRDLKAEVTRVLVDGAGGM
jgi:hypothetical protein